MAELLPQVMTEEEAQAWVDWNAPDCVVGENPRALRVAFLHGYRAGTRAVPQTAVDVADVDAIARIVYAAMCWTVVNPPVDRQTPNWQPGGNSFAQSRARDAARDIAAAIRSQPPAAGGK